MKVKIFLKITFSTVMLVTLPSIASANLVSNVQFDSEPIECSAASLDNSEQFAQDINLGSRLYTTIEDIARNSDRSH